MQRLPRLVELILAIALCALLAFWVTRLLRGETIAAPAAVGPAPGASNQRLDGVLASARLFGSRPPGALSDNVRALGVIADASGRGSVIISVDGQTPKVYRVGDTLDGRLVAAIRPDEIELEAGGARQVFRLPPPQPSADGVTVLGTGPAPMDGPSSRMPRPSLQNLNTPPGMTQPAPPDMAPPPGMVRPAQDR